MNLARKTGIRLAMALSVLGLQLLIGAANAASDYTEGAEDVEGSIYDVPEVVALEKKRFHVSSDFTFSLGLLPMDAFYKAVTFGLSYSTYYGPHWGWEVINAQYCKSINTNLKETVETATGAKVAADNARKLIDPMQSVIYTSVIYTPIYSKSLFFNKHVVFNETSFVAGLGIVNFESSDRAIMLNAGMQWRLFTSKERSIKTDMRFGYHTGEGKDTNLMILLGIGYSFHTGTAR